MATGGSYASPVGLPREALDTPARLVDLDVLEANIARIAAACTGQWVVRRL
jgi:D-serine deaminase-like pyridoxal phosphate-dependent protein